MEHSAHYVESLSNYHLHKDSKNSTWRFGTVDGTGNEFSWAISNRDTTAGIRKLALWLLEQADKYDSENRRET